MNLPSFEPIVWALVWAKSAVKRIARFGEKIFFLVGKSQKKAKSSFCQIFRSIWSRSLGSDQIPRSDHWFEKSDLDQIKSDLDHWSDLKKIRSTMLWNLVVPKKKEEFKWIWTESLLGCEDSLKKLNKYV